MILIIDNYDSFTYNLVQYVSEITSDICVRRNDAITLKEIEKMPLDAIIFSPGPGIPKNAGIMEDIIKNFYKTIPMLGICLGHQAICEVFHATITHAKTMKHGESTEIQILNTHGIFIDITPTIMAGRYHSLIAENIKAPLLVTAISDENEVMAIAHDTYPIYGVQFHPESLLTPSGKQILKNFIRRHTTC